MAKRSIGPSFENFVPEVICQRIEHWRDRLLIDDEWSSTSQVYIDRQEQIAFLDRLSTDYRMRGAYEAMEMLFGSEDTLWSAFLDAAIESLLATTPRDPKSSATKTAPTSQRDDLAEARLIQTRVLDHAAELQKAFVALNRLRVGETGRRPSALNIPDQLVSLTEVQWTENAIKYDREGREGKIIIKRQGQPDEVRTVALNPSPSMIFDIIEAVASEWLPQLEDAEGAAASSRQHSRSREYVRALWHEFEPSRRKINKEAALRGCVSIIASVALDLEVSAEDVRKAP